MDVLDRISQSALIPVVVLDNSEDALPTANALLSGGVDVMEITFRTDAAAAAIHTVSERCPAMLVGAGTVLNLEQCRRAVELGARFLVSPGFDPAIVRWCVDRGVTIIPGCVTPSEIMSAIAMGLRVVKFFPANIYGGLEAMKALSAPFGSIRFIPPGGVGPRNVAPTAPPPLCMPSAAVGSVPRRILPQEILTSSQPCAGRPARPSTRHETSIREGRNREISNLW